MVHEARGRNLSARRDGAQLGHLGAREGPVAYCGSHAFTAEFTSSHWILDWSLDESEDDDRFGMDDGTGWMGRLLPLRDELLRGELLRGDWRPLYLGWLVGAGELRDNAVEPEVPPGLADLSPAQQGFGRVP